MVLTAVEIDSFNDTLRALNGLIDRREIEEKLAELAAQLRMYERQINVTSSLSAYDRRVANMHLSKLSLNLANARQLKAPRRAFSFASRKYLRNESEKVADTTPEIQYHDEHVTSDVHNTSFCLRTDTKQTDHIVRNCSNATLILPLGLSTLYIDDCTNCIIFCSRVSGALHMERCTGLQIVVTCHQLRIHHTRDSVFIASAGSSPIIEHCSGLQFAPILRADVEANAALLTRLDPNFKASLLSAGLDPALDEAQCTNVRDFSWLKGKAGENPNYKAYSTSDAPELTISLSEALGILVQCM